MNEHTEFLSEVEAFLQRTGMAHTRFGKDAMKDGNFVSRLREGKKSLTLRTVARVRSFMRENEP